MKRQVEFDLLKGLGILFVILGHSVPDFPVNLRADMLSSTLEHVCLPDAFVFRLCRIYGANG